MTFKVADIANEAELIEIAEGLSDALSEETTPVKPLDLDLAHIDAAKTLLAALAKRVASHPTEPARFAQPQAESFLDFDPEFLEAAKDMLRTFIEQTENRRGKVRL